MPKIQYTVRLDETILEKAKIIAEMEVRSLNNLIEFFVTKGVSAYEEEHGEISAEK